MPDTDAVAESLRVRADLPTVYDVVGDVASYPEWLSEFKGAEVLAAREDGWAERARFTVGAAGLTVSFTLAYTYADTEMAWSLVEGDMLQALDGAYEMVDEGDGTTTLTYRLQATSSVPLPGMVRRRVARKIVKDSLQAIKQRAEAA